jgi:hypothetical protein
MLKTPKHDYHCQHCGSRDVRRDTEVAWDHPSDDTETLPGRLYLVGSFISPSGHLRLVPIYTRSYCVYVCCLARSSL